MVNLRINPLPIPKEYYPQSFDPVTDSETETEIESGSDTHPTSTQPQTASKTTSIGLSALGLFAVIGGCLTNSLAQKVSNEPSSSVFKLVSHMTVFLGSLLMLSPALGEKHIDLRSTTQKIIQVAFATNLLLLAGLFFHNQLEE